jgi:hypothetical protein
MVLILIQPIRNSVAVSPLLVYDTSSGEISYSSSSIRYKKNIINLNQDTSKIFQLSPREYDSKIDGKHHLGLIAEEVESIDPNVTFTPLDI